MGSGSGWASAPFLQQSQPSDNSASNQMDTYSQAVNGQQQQNALNFSNSTEEYPSLSGAASQMQSQTSGGGGVWNRPIPTNQQSRQSAQNSTTDQPNSSQSTTDRDNSYIPSRQNQGGFGARNTIQPDVYGTAFGRSFPPGIEPRGVAPDGDSRDLDRLASSSDLRGLASSRSPGTGPLAVATGLGSIGQPLGQAQDGFGGQRGLRSPSVSEQAGEHNLEESLNNLSAADRWGLPGFLASYNDPLARNLMRGQDLSGLLPPRNERSGPVHKTWSGPFASEGSAPPRPLPGDYTIPGCYQVQNITPLHQRINGFTEDTLFMIFYTMPRDIMQEIVAEELMGRKWRFHLREKMWLTRDEQAAQPVEIEPGVSESGTYLWWNPQRWRRERRQFILRYDELDDHLQRGGVNAGAAAVGANGSTAGNFNAVPSLERLAAGMGRNF